MKEENHESKFKDNHFFDELNKMVGKDVVVKTIDGEIIEGVLTGIHVQYLNLSIMTDTEKIIIKNVASFRRKREKDGWKK